MVVLKKKVGKQTLASTLIKFRSIVKKKSDKQVQLLKNKNKIVSNGVFESIYLNL